MKKIVLLLTIAVLTWVNFHTYLDSRFPYTNDGENHLARFANYRIALKEGQIPPRFAPNLINHYGYPVFNFNYPLANILSLPLSAVKLNPELSFKLIAVSAYVFGLIGMMLLLSKRTQSTKAILLGLVVFGTAPYFANTILFRGSIGELLALTILPWVLLTIHKTIENHRFSVSTVIIWSVFLLSHNVSVVISIPFLLAYTFFMMYQSKKITTFFSLLKMSVASIGLTLWFWLPALAEADETVVRSAAIANQFFQHFPTTQELLFGQLRFGFSEIGPVDSLGMQLGVVVTVSIFLSMLAAIKLLITKQKISKRIFFLFSTVLLLIFLQLDLSSFIWKLISPLQIIQFPWRLALLTTLVTPLLLIEVIPYLSRKLLYLVGMFALMSVYLIAQLTPIDYFHKEQIEYDLFSQSTSTQNENRTKNFSYIEIGDWKPTAIIEGNGRSDVRVWTGSHRFYKLNLQSTSLIIEPTMNFLGWETTVIDKSGKKESIRYIDNNHTQGRIAFELPSGEYEVRSRFTQNTIARKMGNSLFVVTLTLLIGFFIIRNKVYTRTIATFRSLADTQKLIVIATIWWVFLFIIGAVAHFAIPFTNTFSTYAVQEASQLPDWFKHWGNFDGGSYMIISEKGYLGIGLIQAYFPAYPIILKIVTDRLSFLVPLFEISILDVRFISGIGINFILTILLFVVANRYFSLRFSMRQRTNILIGFLLFPTAFFIHALYTETFFLFLLVLSLYFYHKKKLKLLSITLIGLTATRIVGIVLVPALVLDLLFSYKWDSKKSVIKQVALFTRQHFQTITAIVIGGSGLALYMWYLWMNFQDPLYFFHVQSSFGAGRQQSIVTFPQVVWRYIKILWTARPFNLMYFNYLQEFLFTMGTLLILVIAFIKRKQLNISLPELFFSIGAFFLPTLTGNFSSMPRYVLVCLPIFIVTSRLFEKSKLVKYIYVTLSTCLACMNIILFIQGHWVA